jgi:hypothetical protein
VRQQDNLILHNGQNYLDKKYKYACFTNKCSVQVYTAFNMVRLNEERAARFKHFTTRNPRGLTPLLFDLQIKNSLREIEKSFVHLEICEILLATFYCCVKPLVYLEPMLKDPELEKVSFAYFEIKKLNIRAMATKLHNQLRNSLPMEKLPLDPENALERLCIKYVRLMRSGSMRTALQLSTFNSDPNMAEEVFEWGNHPNDVDENDLNILYYCGDSLKNFNFFVDKEADLSSETQQTSLVKYMGKNANPEVFARFVELVKPTDFQIGQILSAALINFNLNNVRWGLDNVKDVDDEILFLNVFMNAPQLLEELFEKGCTLSKSAMMYIFPRLNKKSHYQSLEILLRMMIDILSADELEKILTQQNIHKTCRRGQTYLQMIESKNKKSTPPKMIVRVGGEFAIEKKFCSRENILTCLALIILSCENSENSYQSFIELEEVLPKIQQEICQSVLKKQLSLQNLYDALKVSI